MNITNVFPLQETKHQVISLSHVLDYNYTDIYGQDKFCQVTNK